MNKILVDDLYYWMEQMEEDPIVDSPFMLTRKDQLDFVNLIDKSIISETNFNYLFIDSGLFSDDQESYLVNLFVDFLNSKGFDNNYIN